MTTTNGTTQHLRIDLACALEALATDAARVAMARAHVNHTGGSFTVPGQCGNWGSHMAELTLLDATGTGIDEADAVRNWIRAVTNMSMDAEFQGYAA